MSLKKDDINTDSVIGLDRDKPRAEKQVIHAIPGSHELEDKPDPMVVAATSTARTEKVIRDPNGEQLNRVAIAFDRDQFKKGFNRPFTLSVKGTVDREGLINDVIAFLKDLDNPEDRRVKDQFIAWFCDMFRLPNTTFYSEDNLRKAIDNIGDSIEKLNSANDELIPASPLKVMTIGKEDDYGRTGE